MSTQFEPKEVLSKNKAQYDSLTYNLRDLYKCPIQDNNVSAQIKAYEKALSRIDEDWAEQKEP